MDLTDIYDKNLGEDDEKDSRLKPTYVSGTGRYTGKGASTINPSEYAGYFPDGVVENAGDINLRRGEQQSGFDKFGNTIAQTVGKTGTQLIDMAGGLTSLLTEWGDARDYQNPITDVAESANDWLNKQFPLYRSTTGTWNFSDGAYVGQLFSSLASSVAGFAIGTGAIATGLGAIGKAAKVGTTIEELLSASNVVNSLAKAKVAVNTGEQFLTAGMQAYSEAAQFGRNIYRTVYDAQIAQGKSTAEAEYLAAESAATGVQLNTMLGTATNMLGGVGNFFNHEKNKVIALAEKEMMLKTVDDVPEELSKFQQRLKGMTATKYAKDLGVDYGIGTLKHKAFHAGKEAVGEGIEELTNMWAEKVGVEEGKKGKVHGLIDQLSLISDYADYTMNEEGGLNFFLGAVAGPLQGLGSAVLPWNRVAMGTKTIDGVPVDKKGKPVTDIKNAAQEYKWVNSFQKNKIHTTNMFNMVRDRIVEDAAYLQDKQEALAKAYETNNPIEVDKAKRELFNLMQLNTVQMGMTNNLKANFQSILDADNTKTDKESLEAELTKTKDAIALGIDEGRDVSELYKKAADLDAAILTSKGQTVAMKLGFTDSKENNIYKEEAAKAIKSLDAIQGIHKNIYAKFAVDKEVPHEAHVADFVFRVATDQYLTTGDLEATMDKLNKLSVPVSSTEALDEAASAQMALVERMKKGQSLNKKATSHNATLKILKDYENDPTEENAKKFEEVLDYLGVVSMEGESAQAVANRLITIFNRKSTELDTEIETFKENTLNSPEFVAWQLANPEGTITQYQKYVQTLIDQSLLQDKLEEAVNFYETKLDVLNATYAEITKASSLNKISKVAKDYFETLNKKLVELDNNRSKLREEKQQNISELRKTNQDANKRLQNKYIEKLKALQAELKSTQEELKEFKAMLPKILLANETDAVKKVQLLEQAIQSSVNKVISLESQIEQTVSKIIALNDELDSGLSAPEDNLDDTSSDAPLSTPIPIVSDKLKEYFDLLASLNITHNKDIQAKIASIVAEGKYSLDALIPLGLTAEESAKVITALKDYLATQGKLLSEIESILDESEVASEALSEVEPYVIDAIEELPNIDRSRTAVPAPNIMYGGVSGKKQDSPANAGSSKSTKFTRKRGDDSQIFTISKPDLEPGHSLTVLDANGLLEGTKVTLQIDTTQTEINLYDEDVLYLYPSVRGSKPKTTDEVKNDKGKKIEFFNKDGSIKVLDENGKENLEVIDNIPISIKTLDGVSHQWLHRCGWIMSQDPQAENSPEPYYNVRDIVDEVEGNAIAQMLKLRAYRKAICAAYNAGIKVIPTQVESKTSNNYVETDKKVLALDAIKESHLEGEEMSAIPLALVMNGEFIGTKSLSNTITDRIEKPDEGVMAGLNGQVCAIVQDAVGNRKPIALYSDTLDKDKTAIDTIIRATELFLSHISAETSNIKDNVNFDLNTTEGYRNFISQYFTYFNKMDDSTKGMKLVMSGKDIFIREINELGVVQNVQLLLDQNNSLSEQGKTMLSALLSTRYKRVALTNKKIGIVGLNTPSTKETKFIAPEYVVNSKGEGQWVMRAHNNYNDYLLKHLYSPIVYINHGKTDGVKVTDSVTGKTTISYFYSPNPVIKYDMDPVKNIMNTLVKEPSTETVAVESYSMAEEEQLPLKQTVVGTNSTAKYSIDNIQDLSNFTPSSEHNGKDVLVVYNELLQSGIKDLPPGFNPFKTCK